MKQRVDLRTMANEEVFVEVREAAELEQLAVALQPDLPDCGCVSACLFCFFSWCLRSVNLFGCLMTLRGSRLFVLVVSSGTSGVLYFLFFRALASKEKVNTFHMPFSLYLHHHFNNKYLKIYICPLEISTLIADLKKRHED